MRSKALILIMYLSKLHPNRNNGTCTCDALENLRTYASIPLQLYIPNILWYDKSDNTQMLPLCAEAPRLYNLALYIS